MRDSPRDCRAGTPLEAAAVTRVCRYELEELLLPRVKRLLSRPRARDRWGGSADRQETSLQRVPASMPDCSQASLTRAEA
jgi:hypothetical protein